MIQKKGRIDVSRNRSPQTKHVAVMCIVTRDRCVIRDCKNCLSLLLDILLHPLCVCFHTATSEVDHIANISPFDFPRIAIREPVIRIFDLPPIYDSLLEHAVVVPNAIPKSYITRRISDYHRHSLSQDCP